MATHASDQKINEDTPSELVPKAIKEPPHSASDHPFNIALSTLLSDLQAISTARRIVMPHVINWLKEEHKKNAELIKKFKVNDEEKGTSTFRTCNAHEEAELLDSIKAIQKLAGAGIPLTLQKSLFIQIFSEFDAFTGLLLKAIYTRKSELLKSISREMTFAELLEYEDIAAVKSDMLEKEVDSFRRDGYVDQFAKLESKFGIKTLRCFPEWPEFIELSQRRNLLVHNGGRVSEQYLSICDRENYKFPKRPTIGDQLYPSGEYFSRAIVVVSKVSFMLTHTLWRKLCGDETEVAHTAANDTIYRVLEDKRWNTAREISEFALNEQMVRKITDFDLRIRIINAAIAAKFSNKEDLVKKHIASIDWSASYRDFNLAIAVLEDRFEDASKIMLSIGQNGEVVKEFAYHSWPLFHKFRESKQFMDAYKEIYKTSFIREAVRHSVDDVEKQEASLLQDADQLGALEPQPQDLQPPTSLESHEK